MAIGPATAGSGVLVCVPSENQSSICQASRIPSKLRGDLIQNARPRLRTRGPQTRNLLECVPITLMPYYRSTATESSRNYEMRSSHAI